MCNDSLCVASHHRCDGKQHCKDGSDETGCTVIGDKNRNQSLEHHSCEEDDWHCQSSDRCIHKNWICDGTPDCPDGSDEINCTSHCSADEIICKPTRRCLPRSARCNGVVDCPDHSDELKCLDQSVEYNVHSAKQSLKDSCESQDQFKCNSSGHCLPLSSVCDGINDCGDWSDEPSNCGINECLNESLHHCSQVCIDDPIGFHCGCLKGFQLSSDNHTCEDVNECDNWHGICSGQPCVNLKGHFKCECLPGYELSEHFHCKMTDPQETSMLFTNGQDIRILTLSPEGDEVDNSHFDSLFTELDRAVAIDYNLRGNYIIWSEMFEGKIYIGKLNKSRHSSFASDDKKLLITLEHNSTVEGIAIDHIHHLVYWTDAGRGTIEVASVKDPSSRRVLINSDLKEPRSIIVDVEESRLFWTDWGDRAKIESSRQDGSDRRTVISHDIIWPNGLTLDPVTKHLYWVDSKLGRIETCDINGGNRFTILESKVDIDLRSFSIASYGDNVYWTNPQLDIISRSSKYHLSPKNSSAARMSFYLESHETAPKVHTVLADLFSVWVVKIVNPTLQPVVDDRCVSSSCSHLCLPVSPTQFKCSCPDNLSNSQTCLQDTNVHSSVLTSVRQRLSHQPDSVATGHQSSVKSDTSSSSQHILTVLLSFSIAIAFVFLLFGLIIYRNYKR